MHEAHAGVRVMRREVGRPGDKVRLGMLAVRDDERCQREDGERRSGSTRHLHV